MDISKCILFRIHRCFVRPFAQSLNIVWLLISEIRDVLEGVTTVTFGGVVGDSQMVKPREEDQDPDDDDGDGSVWMLDFDDARKEKSPKEDEQRANQEEEDGQSDGLVRDFRRAPLEL